MKDMREELKYPKIEAIDSVLMKIGVEPSSRYDEHDQDHEYTTCRIEEIEKYFTLYKKNDTTFFEKRVLGCYFLECLNEYLEDNKFPHVLQNEILSLLHTDIEIHESELEYWSNTSNGSKEDWWAITSEIINWRNT